jgi:type I restriction enzyme S subunit
MTYKPPARATSEFSVSSIPWMSAIPSYWGEERGKWLFKRVQREPTGNDEVVTCFRDGTVTLRKNRRVTGFTESLKEIGYQAVRKGELVIHAMDAFAGAVGVSDSDGKCTPVYSVCQPAASVSSEYYALIVREMARTGFILSLSKGIRERSTDFRFETFASQILPVPPLEEQQKIVSFIQQHGRRIRKFINNKKNLLRIIEERLRAETVALLTNGSAVAPKSITESQIFSRSDWTVKRAKFLFEAIDIRSTTGCEELLTVSAIDGIVPRSQKEVTMFMAQSYIGHKLCWEGDLVINSLWAWARGLGFSRYNGLVSSAYGVYRLKPRYRPFGLYLHHALRSLVYDWELRVRSKGIWKSRLQLTDDAFFNIPIALPPLREAQRICSEIEILGERFEKQRNLIDRQIKSVTEYYQRLISDAVTGRVDLRRFKHDEDTESLAVATSHEVDNCHDGDEILEDGEELLAEEVNAN